MIHYIISAHGNLSEALKKSAAMIFGDTTIITNLNFLEGEGIGELTQKFESLMSHFSYDDQLIIMVDMWGGTPFNVAAQYASLKSDQIRLITGVNLMMVIDALTMEHKEDIDAIALQLIESGKGSIDLFKSVSETTTETKEDEL